MTVWPNGTLGIVEDSDTDYAMFERVFAESIPIQRWATAEDALLAFERHTPDVSSLVMFVVDLHLPGMDGAELIGKARKLEGGDRPTICVLSTSVRQTDQDRAKAAGADGYIVKPDDLRGLRDLPLRMAQVSAAR